MLSDSMLTNAPMLSNDYCKNLVAELACGDTKHRKDVKIPEKMAQWCFWDEKLRVRRSFICLQTFLLLTEEGGKTYLQNPPVKGEFFFA